MRTLAVCLALLLSTATIYAEPDPEIFEFDSAEKIVHVNETASSSDVETLSPVKPSDGKVKIEAKCLLPKAEGNGTDQIAVFHFDPKTQTCHPFNYTGAGGNDNIFLSELDCLSDCYLPVGEGTPEREEDVVIIGRSKRESAFPAASDACRLSKVAGNGNEAVEKFYFAPEWQACMAFKYTGKGENDNRFNSRLDCESACLVSDGSICHTPSEPAKPLKSEFGGTCAQTKCPEGYTCRRSPFGAVSCCKTDEQEALLAAHAETCPDGSQARGTVRDYFVATFGASCSDLICGTNETCQQVNAHFAKCCRNEKPSKKPHGTVRRRQAEPGLRQREGQM